MPEKQYCLRWNYHQPNIISTFSSLLTDECLVDVTLAAEEKYIQAHKIVLSACSTYFQKLFSVNPCQHPIVILKDVKYQDLKSIINFIYRGEVSVNHDHLDSILKTAVSLNIKGLADMPLMFPVPKKEQQEELDESTASKKKKIKKSNRSSNVLKNTEKEVEILRYSDSNEKSDLQSSHSSESCTDSKEHIKCDFQNNVESFRNNACTSASSSSVEPPPSIEKIEENSGGISVITGVKRRGRLLIRQDNVTARMELDDDDKNSDIVENKRPLIKQFSDPTPQQNTSPDVSVTVENDKSRLFVSSSPHLLKQNSDSVLNVPREVQSSSTLLAGLLEQPVLQNPHPKSIHCPTLRPGPALGCNFCWNTIDKHGRILRRKTKYHCPECCTNLCIVPCFQDYHSKKDSNEKEILVPDYTDAAANIPPVSIRKSTDLTT